MKRLLILLALVFVPTCNQPGTLYAQQCTTDGTQFARLIPAVPGNVGGGVPAATEANQTYGYCTGSGTNNNSTNKTHCIKFTPTSDFTLKYIWAWVSTQDASEGTMYGSIFNNDATPDPDETGSVLSTCSDNAGVVPVSGSLGWAQTSWNTGYLLTSGTTYWACVHFSENITLPYWTASTDDCAYNAGDDCQLEPNVFDNEIGRIICVGNYDAK